VYICRATFEHPTPLPRNPFVRGTLTTHCNKLSAKFRRTNILSMIKSSHQRHFTRAGFSFFEFNFNSYSEQGKMITPSYTKRVLLHIQHMNGIQKMCGLPARLLFAVGSYFPAAPHLTWNNIFIL
jgi:hypothetical protein